MGPLSEVSNRIDRIYREFYKDSCRRKIRHIMSEADSAIASGRFDKDKFVWHVDQYRIFRAVISYYLDVIKYKEYHFNPYASQTGKCDPFSFEFADLVHGKRSVGGEKLINSEKVAAFTVKWLLKYQPIVVMAKPRAVISHREIDEILSINAIFAMEHAIALMGRDLKSIDGQILDNLIYHFKYRNTDDRSLMLAFSMLKKT